MMANNNGNNIYDIVIKYDLGSQDNLNQKFKSNENNNIIQPQYNNYIQNEIYKINNDNENKLTIKIKALKKTYWMCCSKNIRAINNLYLDLKNNALKISQILAENVILQKYRL